MRNNILILIFFSFILNLSAQKNYYWEQKVSLFEVLPGSTEDIVFFGNSITDGGEFGELLKNSNIKNRGISGDVVTGMIERQSQVTRHKPKKIFLLIGINDIASGVSPQVLAGQYEKLVKLIHENSPSTELYVQSILPIDTSYNRYKGLNGKSHLVKETNNLIKKIADKYGDQYIDLWTYFINDDEIMDKKYSNDGLHLTGEGYLKWIELINPYIN